VSKSGGRILIRPPLNFSDYFFFAAFFLAFFFAAIIVSFKVNLGIVHVQFAVRTPNARFFSNDLRLLLRRSTQKIRENLAWCVNSMPQLKKNATLLLKKC